MRSRRHKGLAQGEYVGRTNGLEVVVGPIFELKVRKKGPLVSEGGTEAKPAVIALVREHKI